MPHVPANVNDINFWEQMTISSLFLRHLFAYCCSWIMIRLIPSNCCPPGADTVIFERLRKGQEDLVNRTQEHLDVSSFLVHSWGSFLGRLT